MGEAQPSEFDVIGRIYDAALEPRLWSEVVGEIGALQGATKSLLLTSMHSPAQGGLVFPVGIPESAMQLWAERYIGQDLWSRSIAAKGLYEEGRVLTDDEFVPHGELLRSVWYREFLSTIDIARVCTGIIFGLNSPGMLPTALSVYRGADDEPFGERERAAHRILVPHLSRALGIMYRLRDADLKVAATRAALDRIAYGVLLFGSDREVIFANRAARALLQEEDGLRLHARSGAKSRLAAGTENAQRRLDAGLAQCMAPAAGDVDHFSRAIVVQRPSGRAPYAIQVSALPPVNEFGAGSDAARAIAFVTDPVEPVKLDEALLANLFGLTPAEVRLAEHLCKGKPLAEIAERLDVSENTVKSQLKSVFEKTGTGRQAELVKLLLSLGSTRAG